MRLDGRASLGCVFLAFLFFAFLFFPLLSSPFFLRLTYLMVSPCFSNRLLACQLTQYTAVRHLAWTSRQTDPLYLTP